MHDQIFTVASLKKYITEVLDKHHHLLFESRWYINTVDEFLAHPLFDEFIDFAESDPYLSRIVDKLEDVTTASSYIVGIKGYEPASGTTAGDKSDDSLIVGVKDPHVVALNNDYSAYIYTPNEGWSQYDETHDYNDYDDALGTQRSWDRVHHPALDNKIKETNNLSDEELVKKFAERYGLLLTEGYYQENPDGPEEGVLTATLAAHSRTDITPEWHIPHSEDGWNNRFGVPFYDPVIVVTDNWGQARVRNVNIDELYGAALQGGVISAADPGDPYHYGVVPGLFLEEGGVFKYRPHASSWWVARDRNADIVSRADVITLIHAPAWCDFRKLKYFARQCGIITHGSFGSDYKGPKTKRLPDSSGDDLEFKLGDNN